MARKRLEINAETINGIKFYGDEITAHNTVDPITEAALAEIKSGNLDGKLDTRVYEEQTFDLTEDELNDIKALDELALSTPQIGYEDERVNVTSSLITFNREFCEARNKKILNKKYRDLSLVTKMPQFAFLGDLVVGDKTSIKATNRPEPAPYLPFVYPYVCLIRNLNNCYPEFKERQEFIDESNVLNIGLSMCKFADALTVRHILCEMITLFVDNGCELHPEILKVAAEVWIAPELVERPHWLPVVDFVNPYI